MVPAQLYPHEFLTLDWLDDRYKNTEDGLVEKSRDMGVTWMVCMWLFYHWLWDVDFSALIGSRKEDIVDNGLPDSIFGKFDYMVNNLPPWLLPAGFDRKKHRNFLKLVNPETGGSITGESTNPSFSRSGRYSVIFIDEFAFVEKSGSIWQAAGDSSPVRIPVSTPDGKGNKFADLALGNQIQKLTLHWRLHPEKDDAWYERECQRRTSEEIAQELDISYEGSKKGQVYGEEWGKLVGEGRLKTVEYDEKLPVSTSWDFGIGDATAVLFWQEGRDGVTKLIDAYENTGKPIDHYIEVVKSKPYRYWFHVGDMTIKRRELGTGKSVWELLRQQGITLRGKIVKKKVNAINAARVLMRTMEVDKSLTPFIDAIENYHYEWDEDRRIFHSDPVHDWSSHMADALSYYAFNRKDFQSPDERPERQRVFDPLSVTTYGR